MVIQKPKWALHVVQADDAASSSSSGQGRARDNISAVASDPESARDVACSVIVEGVRRGAVCQR